MQKDRFHNSTGMPEIGQDSDKTWVCPKVPVYNCSTVSESASPILSHLKYLKESVFVLYNVLFVFTLLFAIVAIVERQSIVIRINSKAT